MSQLKETLAKIWEGLLSLLGRFEESPVFEKILVYYQNLDPSRQQIVRGVLRLSCFGLALYIIAKPLVASFNAKRLISVYEEQSFRIQQVAARGSEVISQAKKPSSWQPLNAGNSREMENSLRDFLANIGVAEDLFVAQPNGLDRLNLSIEELTLKQLIAITFQFDGWYPQVKTEKLEVQVHPANPDRLKLTLLAYIPSSLPGGDDSGGVLDDHDHEFESDDQFRGDSGSGSHFSGNGGAGSGNGPGRDSDDPDYFEGDSNRIPPPPTDFNESQPPPPPTFEEGFDDPPPVFEDGGDI